MEIEKLTPQGYCHGVKNALHIVDEALASSTLPKPIYLLGSIIHNQGVVEKYKKNGCILLEEKGVSKEQLLDKISSGTVIISAHGVAPIIYEKAHKKGLTLIDTTCGNVLLVQKRIKEYLTNGYKILYIGTKGHPECEGILGISSSICCIENLEDIDSIAYAEKIYATNQTTLSIFETEKLYEKIKSRFPTAILDNKICQATTIRQQVCLIQSFVDLCIVVGDKSSSNTKKLALASKSTGINTILVENVEDIKELDFTNIKKVSITSGASTPEETVNEIIEYLKRVD